MNLKNPSFWNVLSVIVALLALVLTQFPPIGQMTKGTDVRIATPESIRIWHELGNVGFTIPIDVYNAGGYTVNISRIECAILERDSGKVTQFLGRSYYNTQADLDLSMGTITLSPDQH